MGSMDLQSMARHNFWLKFIWSVDYPDAKDWYVAEISQVLHDCFTANGYITSRDTSRLHARTGSKHWRELCFFGHGVKIRAKAKRPTYPPLISRERRVTYGNGLPVGEANQLLLVRNVILDSKGCLCKASRTLAAALKYPHHVGAGGEESAS